jgi:hypothetical protein
MVEEHPKNLSLLTSPQSVLSEKKQNATTNNACTLATTAKESACSCECMHDMAIMMQCNLPKLSGIEIPTHIYMVQVVYYMTNSNVD